MVPDNRSAPDDEQDQVRDQVRDHIQNQDQDQDRVWRRALFEAIDDGFCIIEFIDGPHGPLSDYVHIEANSGYQRHTGIAGIVGKRLREIEPDHADTWLAFYGKVLETGEPVRFEQEFVAVGRQIEVSATRVGPREMRQVSVLFRDVTQRKATEAALRENVERVQLALAAGAIIGTWIWDLVTNRYSVDRGFASAFGFEPTRSPEGLGLEEILAAVHPDDLEGLLEANRQAIERGGPYAHQYRTRRRDGRYYWLEANGRVDFAPDGTPSNFPGVLIDIEARRSVEAERDLAIAELRALNETLEQRVAQRSAALRSAEEALRQAQKMEAVGQLTGGLAHDFNNILAGISGSLELMKLRLGQGRLSELDRHLGGAQAAAGRAAGLTQRLLAFSRRQTLAPRPSDLNQVVAGMQELIGRTAGPGITVVCQPGESLWPGFVDVGQLENALLNLCINARDAMPQGGTLIIRTSNEQFDEAQGSERGVAAGDYVALSVEDNGTGMSAEVLARAFDPFFTTKPIGQGTGLGLSMVYGFAAQSGGAAHIVSAPGKGTTLSIYLPRHAGSGLVENPTGEPQLLPAASAGRKILIVDDEPLVRSVAVEILQELGYRVLEAQDAATAIDLLTDHADIDLLITDVGLPNGVNGRQLADTVRLQLPALPVLFVTGYAEHAVLNHGLLEPGMQILSKPFAADLLASRVRQMTGGESEAGN